MRNPDLAALINNAPDIVEGIGREAVDVYLFLSDQFIKGPVTQNHLFQFVYRSFYRLDNAGLTPEFRTAYFECLEDARGKAMVDIAAIVMKLHKLPTRKGHKSLQFSFVTKLANTIDPNSPIYDTEVAKCFSFRVPYNYKPADARLQEYMAFYLRLKTFYRESILQGSLKELTALFEKTYAHAASRIPPVKVLDFIFWSAGKLGLKLI
jgi:hypothetical protein